MNHGVRRAADPAFWVVVGEEIEIQFIGIRPGEKLSEELFYVDEESMLTMHKKILAAAGDCWLTTEELFSYVSGPERLAGEGDVEGVHSLLKEIVPEYKPF